MDISGKKQNEMGGYQQRKTHGREKRCQDYELK